ncbi:TRI15 protein, partial [Corythaeola cristata]|nr:TRI15 protein [Corythaeola cristata]
LREQEGILLARLHQAHGELAEERSKYISSVSERKSLRDALIAEIEKKRGQPMVEFLTGSSPCCFSLSCEVAKAPIPEPVSLELQRTVESLSEMSQLVTGVVDEFKGKAKKRQAVLCLSVTLDPETASPYLMLSNDCRTTWFGAGQQNLRDTPKRFTGSPSVLGSQG